MVYSKVMDAVSQMTHVFDEILSSGKIPIIQSYDDIECTNGLYRFCGTKTLLIDNQYWRLEFIPDRSNPYLPPEVISAKCIPCTLPMQSYLYGFGIWVLKHMNCKLSDLYPSSLFYCLDRCLANDAESRILRYV